MYLGDHYAGATADSAVARGLARARGDTSDAAVLRQLERDIADDRETLRAVMGELGVAPTRGTSVVGGLVKKAERCLPRERMRRRAPLGDLLDLEALFLGVEKKAACWRSLRTLATTDARLDADRLDGLIARADGQVGVLEALRATAVADALVSR